MHHHAVAERIEAQVAIGQRPRLERVHGPVHRGREQRAEQHEAGEVAEDDQDRSHGKGRGAEGNRTRACRKIPKRQKETLDVVTK